MGNDSECLLPERSPGAAAFDPGRAYVTAGHHLSSGDLGLTAALKQPTEVAALAAIHDLNLAVQYFERFILLSDGQIFALGTAAQVITGENLQRVYPTQTVQIMVNRHPLHHRPFVTVFPGSDQKDTLVRSKREAAK